MCISWHMKTWALIDLLAAELGVTANARRMWLARGVVPARWHLRLLTAAERRGIDLRARDLMEPLERQRA